MPPFAGHTWIALPGPYGMKRIVNLELKAYIETPAPFQSSYAMKRLLAKASREAMRDTMLWHWRKTWREKHFKQTSRYRYRHYKRNPGYLAMKRRKEHTITDHVLTKKSKRVLTQRQPTRITAKQVKGSTVVEGRAFLAPWPFKEKEGGTGVTTKEMSEELARWTDDDVRAAGIKFRERFIHHYDRLMDSEPRLRKRYSAFRAGL